MPGYKGHLIGGLAAFALLLYFLQNQCATTSIAMQWLGCTLAGALFPDIDVKSKGQKYFYWIVLSALIFLFATQQLEMLAACGIISVTPMLCKHRGIFHEMWFVIALPCVVWGCASMAYPQYTESFFFFALFFVVGALSHLYLDRGIRGIIPKKKFKKF
jgi:uncharacterized metal-binding protein